MCPFYRVALIITYLGVVFYSILIFSSSIFGGAAFTPTQEVYRLRRTDKSDFSLHVSNRRYEQPLNFGQRTPK